MLIGFFRQGSCVSLNNAAVNSATCSFSSFIRWQKSSLTRGSSASFISLIFVYGMQFILYGLGDALNGGQIFFARGTATSAASGAFFGGSPFRLAYRPFHYQHVESFFCEHFGLDRIKPGNKPHRFRIVLHLIFGNIQENLIQASFGRAQPQSAIAPRSSAAASLSKYRSG